MNDAAGSLAVEDLGAGAPTADIPAVETLDPQTLALLRRHNLLRGLVKQQVIAEAIQAVALSAEERQQASIRFHNAIDPAQVAASMARTHGWGPEDLSWQVELEPRIRRFSQERFGAKGEARFLRRKAQLDRVVYSLLRLQDGPLARELYFQLSSGEVDFAQLAWKYSGGPEKLTSGVVGPRPLSDAHPDLVERLRTAQPGQVIEPFAVASWWLVVRLDHHLPASYDAAMAERMASEAFQEWADEETTARMARLQATGEADRTGAAASQG